MRSSRGQIMISCVKGYELTKVRSKALQPQIPTLVSNPAEILRSTVKSHAFCGIFDGSKPV